MSDLDNYFSQQDKINQLESMVKELENKIINLGAEKSRYKRLWETAKPNKRARVGRGDDARKAVAKLCDGDSNETLASIARKYFLAYNTIKTMAWNYRRKEVKA